jgi:hypothetical protein
MNNQQKSQEYSRLLKIYDRISNEISAIKGEHFELNEVQIKKINNLKSQQFEIMKIVENMMK